MEKKQFKIPIPFIKKDYVELTPIFFVHKSVVDHFGGLDNLKDKVDAFGKENKDFIKNEVIERLPDFLLRASIAIKLDTGIDYFNRYYDENDKPSDYYTYYVKIDKPILEALLAEKGTLMKFVYLTETMGWFFDKNLGKKEE